MKTSNHYCKFVRSHVVFLITTNFTDSFGFVYIVKPQNTGHLKNVVYYSKVYTIQT